MTAKKDPKPKEIYPLITNGHKDSHIVACPTPINIISHWKRLEKLLAISFSLSKENSSDT